MKLIIVTDKKYGTWLKGHLEKEHPKTKNKIKIRKWKEKNVQEVIVMNMLIFLMEVVKLDVFIADILKKENILNNKKFV